MSNIYNMGDYIRIEIDPNNVYLFKKTATKVHGQGGNVVLSNGAQTLSISKLVLENPNLPTLSEVVKTIQGYIDS